MALQSYFDDAVAVGRPEGDLLASEGLGDAEPASIQADAAAPPGRSGRCGLGMIGPGMGDPDALLDQEDAERRERARGRRPMADRCR